MSIERVIHALVTLGLSKAEAELYVYIANKGPQKVTNLINELNVSRSTAYDSLSALPFEEALKTLITAEREKEKLLKKSKNYFL